VLGSGIRLNIPFNAIFACKGFWNLIIIWPSITTASQQILRTIWLKIIKKNKKGLVYEIKQQFVGRIACVYGTLEAVYVKNSA
jgi:hypothetical protein